MADFSECVLSMRISHLMRKWLDEKAQAENILLQQDNRNKHIHIDRSTIVRRILSKIMQEELEKNGRSKENNAIM